MKKPILALAAAVLAAGALLAESPLLQQPYYVGFLRPNPARKPIEQADRERIMAAHMANIHKMADDGVLAAAGPMEDKPTTISGVFIFKTPSLAEARRIAAMDPTVAEGRNTIDVHTWLGPEGVGSRYFQWKKENPGGKDVMAAHAFCILLRAPPAPAAGAQPDAEHEAFVESLRVSGVLAAAGRVAGDPDIAGIVIFKSDSMDDARGAMARDPAVQSGRLQPEYHRWWSADLVLPW
jgi:uncharacterized protein YciI